MSTNMLKLLEKSFDVGGCGRGRFASLAAYREFGTEAKAQQAAVIERRAALAAGQGPEDAAFALSEELASLGMDREAIQEHLADPQKDVDCLFLAAADLPEGE